MDITLPKDPSSITPLFPEGDDKLKELAIDLIKKSSALSNALHPLTREAISKLIGPMNSYYSNLIEGHNTHPLDIERALKEDYSKEPRKRSLQLESRAHIKVQELMKERVAHDNNNLCSAGFIKWLHKSFYENMPAEFLSSTGINGTKIDVIPGEFRKGEVKVGEHVCPAFENLDKFMHLFSASYDPERISDPIKRIIAIAASHHRLAWIHPFQDGNGRVVRLYSEALFIREEIDANGLWCISRGLAFKNEEYYSALHNADHERWGDYDGRGHLSNKFLAEFCEFFLKAAIDQVEYMSSLLEIDSALDRISNYIDLMASRKKLKPEAEYILTEAFLKGKVGRGEALRLTGKKESTARTIMKDLIAEGLLLERPGELKKALYINFPVKVAPYLFPKLYPKEIEASLIAE
jgi:Fic family protein